MANLRDIRNRIVSIKSTQQITKAMKMVAAAKLRKAQQKMLSNRPYTVKLSEILGRLSTDGELHTLFNPIEGASDKVLYIAVGSDRGLCGAFNNNLIKDIEAHISKGEYDSSEVEIIAIGRKMVQYFGKQTYTVNQKYDGFFDQLNYAATAKIAHSVIDMYEAGRYSQVFICYNEFKSVIAQNRQVVGLLPISPVTTDDSDSKSNRIDYIFEKDQSSILNELVPKHIAVQLWKAALESNASEQGARMTAMDNATENAKDLEQSLKLQYNRARQDSITTELTEIVSGASALENA